MEKDEFTHPYLGLTKKERKEMLEYLGLTSADELFSDIPIRSEFHMEEQPLSEQELFFEFYELSKRNWNYLEHPLFAGGGAHAHYVPAVVQKIIERGEFLTSYTPYQPEISQGMLQALFEYQSMVCELTALDVANASHYTYGSSLGEAAHMAHRINSKNKVVVCGAVNPERLEVLRAYAFGKKLAVVQTRYDEQKGSLDFDALQSAVDDETCMVYVESPNYFGVVEPNLEEVAEIAHKKGALFCVGFDMISLALFKPPGEVGADIAVGEGVGFPISYGGPSLGVFATRKQYVRSMPGRVVGATLDKRGKRGFVITLQTREQHIRREKATSNITTNSAILALANAVYLALLGKSGLKKLAERILSNTHYTQSRLAELKGVTSPLFKGYCYQDFVARIQASEQALEKSFEKHGIIAPTRLKQLDSWLFGVSELTTKAHVDLLVVSIKEALKKNEV
jgi:glycine dehydrogenase subunit 1